MSPTSVLYLIGMALVFAGQRLFAETLGQVLTGLGVLGVAGAIGMRLAARGKAPTPAHRDAHGSALVTTLIGASSLLLYALSTDSAVAMLGFEDEAATRWSVPLSCLWPIAFLVGTLPTLAIDLVLADSPVVLQPRRVAQARGSWILVALGIAIVFPLNYLADELNERWDLAYFKTTQAGDSTRGVVSTLSEPVTVRAFQPPASDVTPELRAYFAPLSGPNLDFQVVDHAAEPALTKELKVRDNGYVAVTLGDDTKTWKVGAELDSSKRNLEKLDAEFHQRLLELARGKITAYFTVGHGEMSWKGGSEVGPDRELRQLKKLFEAQSFRVEELGLGQGLGDAIPDDAGVVVIVAPEEPFLDAEVEALKRYLDGGGSLMVMLEPDGDPLDDLLAHLGLELADGTLTSEKNYVRVSGGLSDRQNVVTNRFSSHGSTATLSKNSRALPMALPTSGHLEERDDFSGKVTVTVRSMPDNWAELDGDLEYDGDTEDKKIRKVAAVSTTGDGDEDFKALVIADATAFSDLVLASIKGNQVYVWDGLAWLTDAEDAAGAVESEEDVKIQHTREDQVSWFYGTTLGIPVVIFLGGLLRIRSRSRKKTGAA